MKKCPQCLKYDSDTTRFCKSCGTELFFEERFEKQFEKKDNFLLKLLKTKGKYK